MSKNKNIKNALDIIDKPIYKDIWYLLIKENKWMTTNEIQSELLMLGITFKKPQNLRKYLNYLTKFGVIDCKQGIKNKRDPKVRTVYRRKKDYEEIVSKERAKTVKEIVNERGFVLTGNDVFDDFITQEVREKIFTVLKSLGEPDSFKMNLKIKRNGRLFYEKKDF